MGDPMNTLFPNAPQTWDTGYAEKCAREEGIILENDHWLIIRILQQCFALTPYPCIRKLHEMFDKELAQKGGLRYLYSLFPGSPVTQGCKIAGLYQRKG